MPSGMQNAKNKQILVLIRVIREDLRRKKRTNLRLEMFHELDECLFVLV